MATGRRELRGRLASRRAAPSESLSVLLSPTPCPPCPPCPPCSRKQRLQQQVARLHEAFRSQESRWAAARRQLQSQIDAVSRQSQELRDGLKALGLPLPGAREGDAAALGTRRKPDTLVQKAFSFSLRWRHSNGGRGVSGAGGDARPPVREPTALP